MVASLGGEWLVDGLARWVCEWMSGCMVVGWKGGLGRWVGEWGMGGLVVCPGRG